MYRTTPAFSGACMLNQSQAYKLSGLYNSNVVTGFSVNDLYNTGSLL